MAVEVTVRDTESGESETRTIADDYIVVAAGTCHVAHVQDHSGKTHVLTIKGRKP